MKQSEPESMTLFQLKNSFDDKFFLKKQKLE